MTYSGIYIHIPFCRNRCNYCDFYITTRIDLKDRYINNILKEIKLNALTYKKSHFNSIYIGGGTPSLLSSKQISDIIIELKDNYNISKNAEITLEVNPEDISELNRKFIEFKNAGINRISFGLQSFNKAELNFLSRFSDLNKIRSSLKQSLKHFENTSVDIIYSLPNSNHKLLEQTIRNIIDLKVPHISAYTLMYEKNTKLYNRFEKKETIKNPDDLEADLYDFLTTKLENAGYNHYEISNYALPGYESVHNLKYWEYNSYLGFGTSSHSFFYPVRWKNFSNIIKYNLFLEKNMLPIEKKHILTSEETENECIFLGLRSKGINLKNFRDITGINLENKYHLAIDILIKENYASLNSEYFSLNQKGYKILDEIVTKYFL